MANKKNEPDLLQRQAGRIHARIIDYKNGLQVISNVRAVRIISGRYRLLILEDYLPTLGKVEGDVVIVTTNGETAYPRIRGFYKLQHNEFTLLIEERALPQNMVEPEWGQREAPGEQPRMAQSSGPEDDLAVQLPLQPGEELPL